MIFLDFLCFFFGVVLLDAHPISKRNSHNISELEKKLDSGQIVESYSTDPLLNHLYPTWKGQIFEEQNGNTGEKSFTKIPKKHVKFKRISSKVMDLRDFERLENFGIHKNLYNSIKTYKFKDKESPEADNMTQITNSQISPISRFLENKHVFYDLSMEPTRDDTEFAGTAEIETILNELKQREIELIADQIPKVSTLISNTVTEATFASMPLTSVSSIYPGFVFSTFLLLDNNTLSNSVHNPQISHEPYLKLHNIALRSIKDDTSTLANDVDNILQKNKNKIYHKIKKLDSGQIVQSYSTDPLLNHVYPTCKGQIFEEQNGNTDEKTFTKIPKKHVKFKRITTKVMGLRDFERLENFGIHKNLYNSIKTYKFQDKESPEANNINLITNSQISPISRFLENKHVFYDLSMEPTRDDTEFAGTAEIETILNELKQREIERIADQIPKVSTLISNTVTEATFASMPLTSVSSVYPGFVFSTFLLLDNNTLSNSAHNPQISHEPYLKLHNIALRSIKDDTSTLANNVENILQKNINKIYHKIKNKISKDLIKESKETSTLIKKPKDKINEKTSSTNVGSKQSSLQKETTKLIPKTQTKSTLYEVRNSRNTLFNMKNNKFTTLTTHTIPTVGDDLSMLSIVEQLLEKSEEDNAINMLTTTNNYSAKKDKVKLFKRNSLHGTLKQSKSLQLNNEEDLLDTEYTHSDKSINNDTENNNIKTDATTEDTSYEALSNKLSYIDYVNGFKYYLKFQKDKEDQKYSNQVRYQAHKHHSVDDIGKFILNKIPQLPLPKSRRDLLNLKPDDVQDVSTKSEDSWFKKHFFIFMDSNTPKKFHTAETVSLKPSAIQIKRCFLDNQTTNHIYNNKEFSYLLPQRVKKTIDGAKKMSTKTSLDGSRFSQGCGTVKRLRKRSNLENYYKQKSDALTSNNYKKNGFVDLNLINKPTAIIKLNNKNKKTNKIRHIFNKIRFGHNKHKKKEKRQSQNRFNIFKGIRNIFKDKNELYKEFKTTKRHKFFDYEVMSTNKYAGQPNEEPTFRNILKIDELRQQVPNISADFSIPHTIFTEPYLNLTDDLVSMSPEQLNKKFTYNGKQRLDDERKRFSILTESQYLKDIQHYTPYFIANKHPENTENDLKIDDIINVTIETNDKDVILHEKSNLVGYPVIMGTTKNIIKNDVDDLNMRLLSYDSKDKMEETFPTTLKNEYKNQYLRLLIYPKNKLSKQYQIDNNLITDVYQNNKVNFKKPATMSSANKKYWSKKSCQKNKLALLFNSTPSLAQISSLSSLNNKKLQIDTKSNRQDIVIDKNKIKPNSFEDSKMFAYKQTSDNLITPEGELEASNKNYVDMTKKKPFIVNTPPEQYYNTPLPMQMDDFYNFLKSQHIDVDSVTAPLIHSVSKGMNTGNLNKKTNLKLYSKHNIIMPNVQHLKNNNTKHRASGLSNKTHYHANLNKVQTKIKTTNKNLSKARLEKQKDNRKTTQVTGEITEYENSYCIAKHKRKLRKNSNLMPHLYLGSMDLFQFDNSPTQPVLNSRKETKDIDMTVIDLESKKKYAYKELEITDFNKLNKYQRLRTKTNLSNNDIYRTSLIDPQRDPLRFTHMYNEYTLPKQSMTSPLFTYKHKKTTRLSTPPHRVQISGHSYKYDIIYHRPNNAWMSDLYGVHPTLFADNIVKYRDYTTTMKREKERDHRYYRGNYTLNKNNDVITLSSYKVQKNKEINNLDHSIPKYKSTEVENIALPRIKAIEKFSVSREQVNNTDDEVYFEPLIRHKSNRSISQCTVSNNNKKYYKRNIQDSFTAKDVAAFEVVVDLIKSTESFDDKGLHNALLDIDNQKNIPYSINSLKPQNHATNTIQVHIALPYNIYDKKRSLEPVKVRKIFSAKMSSPVDLEYQIHSIHSFEDDKVTKVTPDVISPGLYLLVENTNITVPKGNFALKPIKRNLILPKSSDLILNYNDNMTDSINDHVSKVTFNPNVIAAVNIQPVKLYENMATLNETKSKRYIKDEIEENELKIKRNPNWESVKKYFSHDRLSQCRCKINKTMCKSCAASDAVITELIFEFDNLASYMSDHCTEIQTFFRMNPTGGKKLKDTVHKIDTILNNSYKRVKSECQGRTCKKKFSNINKREYKINSSINQFLNDLESIADYVQKVVQYNNICDANVHNAAKKCISIINNCIYKNLNKRSYAFDSEELNNKSIYSLNNIRVNLICNKDLTKHATYYTRNSITEAFLERNTNTPQYYDETEVRKNKKIGKGIMELLRKYSNKIKFKNVETSQIDIQNNNMFTKKHIKRHSVSDNQIEAPFLTDSGGTFWYKYLNDNIREPRQQKDIVKQINKKKTISYKSRFANFNFTKTNITKKTTIENTSKNPGSNNDLQEIATKTDDASTKIDSLNHNLNDLFKLLGSIDTLSNGNQVINKSRSKLSKITTLSIKQPRTNIKMKSKLTTTKVAAIIISNNSSSKTPLKKKHLKIDTSQTRKSTSSKIANEAITTKTVSKKTPTPTILHTIKSTIRNSKIGLLNRIVSGSLKFLSNSDKSGNTLEETKSSNIEYRPRQKYRQIFGTSTNAFKNIIQNESLYNRVNFKNTTQKVIQRKNCENCDYDIIYDIRKYFNLTSDNFTTPREGAVNKLLDKFSIKIISDSERIEPNETEASQCTITTKNRKVNIVTPRKNEIASDTRTSTKISSTKTAAGVKNTTKNKSNKNIMKLTTGRRNRTLSNSDSHDHNTTKHLEEADEEKLICDISSTMAYVFKLQNNISNKKFEQYVKNIPCHKYNKTPQHFIIRSCKKKISKTVYKMNRKSKTSELNKDKIHNWVWFRDKRSIRKSKTMVKDDKCKHFEDFDKKCLYGCSPPLIVTNCVNIVKVNNNLEVNYDRDVKKREMITHGYNIKKKNIKNNYKKRNIIHNVGFWNYLLRKRGYNKKSHFNENFIELWHGGNDYYENFVRGKNGIYRKSLKRRKRLDVDMSELNNGLLNLSPLEPFTNEIYVMIANSISFDCHSSGVTKNRNEDYIWTSDRLGILDFDNVMVEGPKVFINKIKTINVGNYMCSVENAIVRNIKITVIDLPTIDIVFTPLYETDTCTYDDLKSLQKLSEPMSYFTYENDCSMRIDEPICLKDSMDGSALISPIVVMTVKRQSNINCSAECLRDLHCSFALLLAKNAPALASVRVLISYNSTKTVLSPLREKRKSFVTHTLTKKDTNGHREYHRFAADMDPNSVNVVLLCSAGFYLIVGQKICAVCPPNTFSLEGENVCRNCPRGARSEPGARSCRLSLHLRRNKCPWIYVCGGAVCMLSCVIASCYAVSRLFRQPVSKEEIKTCRKTEKASRKESHQKNSKNRPLSPSRVILSRLLRGSLSSSRATDSQETRFELWKEKNTLPPLPPIDFEF